MATTSKSRRKADAVLPDESVTAPDPTPTELPPAQKAAARKPARARKPAVPAPPQRFTIVDRPVDGPVGRYMLSDSQTDVPAQLQVHGKLAGDYRCNCGAFSASDDGSCEHSRFLIEQLEAALDAAPPTGHSEIWLAQGLKRQLRWCAGAAAPQPLREAALALFGEAAVLDAELAQGLDPLLGLAAALGHEVRVAPEVWEQLAHAADARARLSRIEATLGEGVDLQHLAGLRQPLPEFQWEAALFALCAGRALLADDLGLGHRATALAVLQLWRRLFGLGKVVLLAPLDRHAAWRADVQACLGGWPQDLQLLQQGEAPLADAELLIVDGVQELTTLPLVPTAQLLLLADRELLGESLLGDLIDWIDVHRRGPLAVWRDEAASASKRQQRELLQAVMLSRRKRDLLPRLPGVLEQALWSSSRVEVAPSAVAELQRLQERWQAQLYLGAGEQLRLMTALQTLRQAAQSPQALMLKCEQLLGLLPQVIPAAAQRVAVFAQQDSSLQTLAAALRAQGLAVAELLLAQTPEQRQAQVEAWRGDEGLVLLACDAACAGVDLQHDRAALVHADQPWNPAQREARAHRLGGESGRGAQAWSLLISGSFDAAQLAAQAGREQLPAATLDFELGARPFLAATDLAALMDALATSGA